MLDFAARAAALRRRVRATCAGDELDRRRLVACGVRLLDLGCFRIGSEDYAGERQPRPDHRAPRARPPVGGALVFDYPAKSGAAAAVGVGDRRRLRRARRAPAPPARRRPRAAARLPRRARWRAVRAEDINAYLKEVLGGDFSAKDFRTWNATVARRRRAWPPRRRRAPPTARAAGDQRGGRASRPMPGQHAGRLPGVIRRSAGVRRFLSGWTLEPGRRRPDRPAPARPAAAPGEDRGRRDRPADRAAGERRGGARRRVRRAAAQAPAAAPASVGRGGFSSSWAIT